jgi:hypothetical protein
MGASVLEAVIACLAFVASAALPSLVQPAKTGR